MRKYHNKPTIYNGVRYASALEARTAQWLNLMRKAGEVAFWDSQVDFLLKGYSPQGQTILGGKRYWFKVGNYRADFRVVFNNNHEEIWECKSKPTRTALYQLKLKILKTNYPTLIHREITKEDLPRILQ